MTTELVLELLDEPKSAETLIAWMQLMGRSESEARAEIFLALEQDEIRVGVGMLLERT